MRIVGVVLALLSAALLQTTLFPFLTVAGFRPDLLLLITVAFAMREGPMTGIRVGFAAGLLSDLLLAESAVGLGALTLMLVGYGVGVAKPYLAQESVSAPIVVAFASGAGGTALYGLISRLLGDERFTSSLVLQAAFVVGLYNTLLSPPAFGLVRRLTPRVVAERQARA